MYVLPEPKPTAPAAGQATPTPTAADRERIRRLFAALDEIPAPTSYDNPDLPSHKDGPQIGTTPPVAQPGIPPQSRAAVDYAVRVLSTGVATAMGSGGVALVMAASHWADPVVCGIVFGAPIGLAIPIAALGSLARRVKEVAPPEIHNHYNGDVHQDLRETHSSTRGVWAKTNNQQ